MPTRRDFGKKPKAASSSFKHAKPINKFKELKAIYNRDDIPAIPLATINSRINEHYNRQNTKEYLNSWTYQRRLIEKKLDEGY